MDEGDGLTRYTLEGEGVGSVFVIDGNTGNIHVTKSLDREEKDEYRLIATATDRETGRALEPSSEFIIRVQDINDNPPVFPNEPYIATVPEMANIGTSIIQVTARDADDPTYGNSARLVYAITHGQDCFSVDAQTGVLRTAMPDMDRESRDEYLVVLQAKDMGGHLGGLSGTTTVTVKLSDVNDNPPHFRRSAWSFSVSELAAPGVEVGRLTASDPDLGENAQLQFTIMDQEEALVFNISNRDREAVLVLNQLLDYETRNSYTFSVEVANPVVDPRFLKKGPFKDQATVRVMVLNADEPPKFSQSRYHLDVSENCPPVCAVGRVQAVDPDTGQSHNIRFSIDPQTDPEALFRISSDSGSISSVMELDREEEQWHNITVIATQRDNHNLVSRVVVAIETLDQNDNAPELDRQYSTSVCDSSAPGQVVQVVRAVDQDQGGQDIPIHFSIAPESSSALNLSIKESGGVTASLVLQSALEPLPGFSTASVATYVPLVLRDGASGLTNTGTVTVTICPCLRGGMHTEDRGRQRDRRWERHMVCVPVSSASPSLIFSLITLLAMLACVTTLLVVCALSVSLRHQKRDPLSPFEDDDVRENIISYDDEGGGEADTVAFDITALQSMHRIQHIQNNNRNIWFTQTTAPRPRTYSCSRAPRPAPDAPRPGSAPLYGRLCYGLQTLPHNGLQTHPHNGLQTLPHTLNHTLPVLRDFPPVGPLESGLQMSQFTPGLSSGITSSGISSTGIAFSGISSSGVSSLGISSSGITPSGRLRNSLVIPNHNSFETLLRSPHINSTIYEAELTMEQRETGAGEREGETGERRSEVEEQAKSVDPEKATGFCDPHASYQSHTSSSSTAPEGRPESSQTEISTSCTIDEFDTDSSISSVLEQNYHGTPTSLPYPRPDTYSIVGSLNANGKALNGTSVTSVGGTGAMYGGRIPLLNMYKENTGTVRNNRPAKPQPLRMEELLNVRLNHVTFDLSQPPYDSLQTYEFEGQDSRAESLSSLESGTGEKDAASEREEATAEEGGGGIEELNDKFQKLVEIIRERQKERQKVEDASEQTAHKEQETPMFLDF
uniref:Cadherin domain-containing protein n=1 Tax=Knipowitschia caucasica TaxID=637954 RepID=A0AAV2KZB5_KNICA